MFFLRSEMGHPARQKSACKSTGYEGFFSKLEVTLLTRLVVVSSCRPVVKPTKSLPCRLQDKKGAVHWSQSQLSNIRQAPVYQA